MLFLCLTPNANITKGELNTEFDLFNDSESTTKIKSISKESEKNSSSSELTDEDWVELENEIIAKSKNTPGKTEQIMNVMRKLRRGATNAENAEGTVN